MSISEMVTGFDGLSSRVSDAAASFTTRDQRVKRDYAPEVSGRIIAITKPVELCTMCGS